MSERGAVLFPCFSGTFRQQEVPHRVPWQCPWGPESLSTFSQPLTLLVLPQLLSPHQLQELVGWKRHFPTALLLWVGFYSSCLLALGTVLNALWLPIHFILPAIW